MINEKKIFLEGMNGDDSPRLLGDKQYLNLMNGRISISRNGRNKRIESVPGHLLVSQSVFPPYGTQQTIGTAQDVDNGRLLFFNYNTHGDHGIYCYDPSANNNTGKIYAVIYDSQVIGGLGFSKNSLIHSARVDNGCLYWVDSTNNEPRRININAGIEMNHAGTYPTVTSYSWPMNQSVVRWIRRQPGLPLTAVKNTDFGYSNNFIQNEAFQFCWRYTYRDYEISTISSLSLLVNYNAPNETFNYVTVTFPTGEQIDQDVTQVDLIVKYIGTNTYFIIRSWNRNVAADLAAINAHNAGTALTFNFYNDFQGTSLGREGEDPYVTKQYDNVPIYAQTCESAKFRSFMANYIIGYDTPTSTSLTVAQNIQGDTTTVTGKWIRITYNSGASTQYFIQVYGSSASDGFYQTAGSPPAATVNFATLTFITRYESAFWPYVMSTYSGITFANFTGDTSTILGSTAPAGLTGTSVFKTGSSRQLSVSFLDHSGRKCGYLTNSNLKVNIADRVYNQVNYTTSLTWTLSNTNALTEIPSWAYYVSVNVTKCLSTRFFVQTRAKNLTYVTKDADGKYLFDQSAWDSTRNGIGIDITLLNNASMGYQFQEGDEVKIYIGSNVFISQITGQDGNWIICQLQNIGTLGNQSIPFTTSLFEIFTPYKPLISEPTYEVAQIFKINNPGTSLRTYSQLSGSINGDVVLLTRNDGTSSFRTENMSPNDKFYLNWNTDSGRPNFIDTIGQVTKTNTICYSNTLIQGSKVNGLSTFDPLDTKDIPTECGDIYKLQNANKIGDEQGTIMLAICRNEIASCYLGEVQLVGAVQNADVAIASNVIGTINILQGSFGTTRPESVTLYLGLVFGVDILKGTVWQYSPNGLEDVSKYNMSRFFRNYCADYLIASTNNLDNINGFHHIRGTVDPYTQEYLATLPGLIYENYANTLPSYTSVPSYATSIINRFDIYDQLGKTMSFSFGDNYWGWNYEGQPEWSEYLQNQLYLFKAGKLYKANVDTANYNNFFGTSYPVRLCFTWNTNPYAIKDVFEIGVEGSTIPNFTVLMSENPNQQITDLASTDPQWVGQEGVRYASFLRDRLSPNASGTADEKLYTGDVVKSPYPYIMLEFSGITGLIFVEFVNIQYSPSYGQNQLIV